MELQDLDLFLFQYTNSEKRHMETSPDALSKRYLAIPKVHYCGRELYLFSFRSLLENKYVCINKESRFTHIPEHIHTVIEFLYVYSGRCTQIINGKKVVMTQGDICMLDTDVPHSVEFLGKDDIIITIEMQKEYLTQGLLSRLGDNELINRFLINSLSQNASHNQFLLFKKENENPIHSIIRHILCEYYDPGLCSDKIIDAYIILLFCEILRQYQNQHFSSHQENDLIIEILNYIETNSLTATLQNTAEHFGFHPNYLSAYIKRKTGKSFKELIIFQRMYQASFYLSNTEMPVYEIAHKIGYDNLGFFYQKFKAVYKMTPSVYRELRRNPIK